MAQTKKKKHKYCDYDREYARKWRKEHPEEARERTKKYLKKHPEKRREIKRRYYHKHKEQCREYVRKYYHEHKERLTERRKERNQKLKHEILSHYSNGKLECANCGEKEFKFLSIDHSFGDGAKHRKEIGSKKEMGSRGGIGFYYWLRRNNYPSDLGLRVLCLNCNQFFGFIRRGKRRFDARVHIPFCQCCNEDRVEVLSFSKKLNNVLCRNCWHALRWYGHCPHQNL